MAHNSPRTAVRAGNKTTVYLDRTCRTRIQSNTVDKRGTYIKCNWTGITCLMTQCLQWELSQIITGSNCCIADMKYVHIELKLIGKRKTRTWLNEIEWKKKKSELVAPGNWHTPFTQILQIIRVTIKNTLRILTRLVNGHHCINVGSFAKMYNGLLPIMIRIQWIYKRLHRTDQTDRTE